MPKMQGFTPWNVSLRRWSILVALSVVVLLAACSSDSRPLPDHVDILYIGDSTGMCGYPGSGPLFDEEEPDCDDSYAVQLARHVEEEYGVDVAVSDFSIHGVASATRQFQELEPLRSAVQQAEIVLLSNSGDAHAVCGRLPDGADVAAIGDEHRAELDEMYETLSALTNPSEVMIRSFGTPWIATFNLDESGQIIDMQGHNCISEVGMAVEEASAAHDITAVHFLTAFNGDPPYQPTDPLLRDTLHLNADGAKLAVGVFHDAGYLPYEVND
jgi:hypothetical protein